MDTKSIDYLYNLSMNFYTIKLHNKTIFKHTKKDQNTPLMDGFHLGKKE